MESPVLPSAAPGTTNTPTGTATGMATATAMVTMVTSTATGRRVMDTPEMLDMGTANKPPMVKDTLTVVMLVIEK